MSTDARDAYPRLKTEESAIDPLSAPGDDGARRLAQSATPLGLRVLTLLVVAFAGLTLWAASVPGSYFLLFMTLPTVWIVLGLTWLFQAVRLWRRSGLGAAARNGWLIGTAAMVLATAAAMSADLPLRLRFEASSPAMAAIAAEMTAPTAPETLPDRWIGLYDAERIERVDGGFRFLVKGAGFVDPVGFAYSPTGQPPIIGEDRYERFVGPWWFWVESW